MTEYVLFCLEVAVLTIFKREKYTWVKKLHNLVKNDIVAESERYTFHWEYLVNN